MKPMTARQVIDHYGGNKKFAEALQAGVTPQAVNNWYTDDKFPANSYVLIIEMCDTAGIRVSDSAFAMRRRRRSR